jgi:replicative DNA helicase
MSKESNEQILARLIDPDADEQAQFPMELEYQRRILATLLSDRQFLLHGVDLIEPGYFVNKNHITICESLFKFFTENKIAPDKIFLTQEISDKLKDDAAVLECTGELNSLLEYYIPGLEAREVLENRIVKFAGKQAFRKAYKESLKLLAVDYESQETWDKVYDIHREAILIDRTFDKGLDYFNEVEERYERMREEIEGSEGFTSGFQVIDDSLSGGRGPSRGEIYAWQALSGIGKSLALVSASVANLVRSKKVLYISCEMSRDKIAERFDAQLAHVAIWELMKHKDHVLECLNETTKGQEDKRQLVIQAFPAGQADVNTLKAYHAKLKMLGFVPDVVIVDYVGEMRDHPALPTYESRERTVRDLKGWATEEDFLCFTAFQSNRSAREFQDKPDEWQTDAQLADSSGQSRPLEGLWSINQSKGEKLCVPPVAQVFISKARGGASSFHFYIEYDEHTLQLRGISEETYIRRMSLQSETAAKGTSEAIAKGANKVDKHSTTKND